MNKSKSSSLLDNTPWILYPIVAPVYYLLIYPLTLFGAAIFKLVSFLFSPIYNLFFGIKKNTPGKFKLAATNDFVAANSAPLSPVKPCVPKDIPSKQHQNEPESTIKKLGNPEGSIEDSSDNNSKPTPATTPIKKSPEKVTEENRETLIEIQPNYFSNSDNLNEKRTGKEGIEFALQILLHFIATHIRHIEFTKKVHEGQTRMIVSHAKRNVIGYFNKTTDTVNQIQSKFYNLKNNDEFIKQDIVRVSSLVNHILVNIYVLGFVNEVNDTLKTLYNDIDSYRKNPTDENLVAVTRHLTDAAANRYFGNNNLSNELDNLQRLTHICLHRIYDFTLVTSYQTSNRNINYAREVIKNTLNLLDILDLTNHTKANLFKSKISNLNLASRLVTKTNKTSVRHFSMGSELREVTRYLKNVYHRYFYSDISQENSSTCNEQPLKLADLTEIENGTDSVQNIYDLLTRLQNSCHIRTPEVINFFANEDFFQSAPMNLNNSPGKHTVRTSLTSVPEGEESGSNYTTPAHSPVR